MDLVFAIAQLESLPALAPWMRWLLVLGLVAPALAQRARMRRPE